MDHVSLAACQLQRALEKRLHEVVQQWVIDCPEAQALLAHEGRAALGAAVGSAFLSATARIAVGFGGTRETIARAFEEAARQVRTREDQVNRQAIDGQAAGDS